MFVVLVFAEVVAVGGVCVVPQAARKMLTSRAMLMIARKRRKVIMCVVLLPERYQVFYRMQKTNKDDV
jgi:hypothetical protein